MFAIRPDEKTRRKSDFQGGEPCKLLNGQEWSIIRPRINYGPSDDGEHAKLFVETGHPEYSDAHDALLAAKTPEDEFFCKLRLVTLNLQTNYNLTNQEVASLLLEIESFSIEAI